MRQEFKPIPSLAVSIPGRIPPPIRDISLDIILVAVLSHRSVIFNLKKQNRKNKAERVGCGGLALGSSYHRNGNRY